MSHETDLRNLQLLLLGVAISGRIMVIVMNGKGNGVCLSAKVGFRLRELITARLLLAHSSPLLVRN